MKTRKKSLNSKHTGVNAKREVTQQKGKQPKNKRNKSLFPCWSVHSETGDACESTFSTKKQLKEHELRVHDIPSSSANVNAESPSTKNCTHSKTSDECITTTESAIDSMIDEKYSKSFNNSSRSFKYVCAYCHCSFKMIKEHIEKEHGGSTQYCGICSEQFECPNYLLSHVKSKHIFIAPLNADTIQIKANTDYILIDGGDFKDSGDYVCNFCDKTHDDFYKLQFHIKSDHNSTDGFFCNTCGKKYSLETELIKHKRNTHKTHSQFKCEIDECSQEFMLITEYKKHQKEHHPKKNEKPVCSICNKTFQNRKNLKNHMAIHLGVKSYTCQTCGERFATANNLSYHKKAKHSSGPPEKFHCPFENCEKSFQRRYDCEKHLLDHDANFKRFQCDKCQSSFVTESKLRLHQKRVHDPPRFICSLCGVALRTNHHLTDHIRSQHTGERPFACEEVGCNKSFITITQLYRHKWVHTGEKRYRCTESGCDRAYMYDIDLKRHKFSAHGIYHKKHPCPICSKIFPENKLLKKHLATHG